MKCPKCGSDLDTGFNCTKCDYKHNQKRLSTAEKLIVIKTDMKELPKGCVYCSSVIDGRCYVYTCRYANRGLGNNFKEIPTTRPEWCPLMEIKESK